MSRPNVLFIMCDQLKATALSVYGHRICDTPSLERLASQGVTFQNAITPHPLCVPARTAIMASRYPHQLGTRRNETLMPGGVTHAFGVWKALTGRRTSTCSMSGASCGTGACWTSPP